MMLLSALHLTFIRFGSKVCIRGEENIFDLIFVNQAEFSNQLQSVDWAQLDKIVWFENIDSDDLISDILKHINEMQNIGQVTKKVGHDTVWFDSKLKHPRSSGSQYAKSVLDLDPVFLHPTSNGFRPEEEDHADVKSVHLKAEDAKWRKAIESNDKVIIRIQLFS